MRFKTTWFLFSLIMILFFSYSAQAADVRTTSITYGLKAGIVSPATWYVGDFSYDPDMGYSFGGFLDYRLGDKITGGIYADVDKISAYETSNNLFDIGITIKAILYKQASRFTFRPGIGIGYGTLGKMDPYASSNYMMLKGFVEAIYSMSGNMSLLGEVGLWGSPNGGNDDFEAYFDTGLIARAGVVF